MLTSLALLVVTLSHFLGSLRRASLPTSPVAVPCLLLLILLCVLAASMMLVSLALLGVVLCLKGAV